MMLIKICGIDSIATALAAQEYGADLLGFVFAASRRQIGAVEAAEIGAAVPGMGKVGVFANQPLEQVQEIARLCKLDYVQLHGEESPEYCQQVGYPIIKAFRIVAEIDLPLLASYKVAWLLLDSYVEGQQGGTGKAFAWESLKLVVPSIAAPFMVAGGLSVDNVATAISLLRPGGVDVSGGVETGGRKDVAKIEQFILVARRGEEGVTDA
jgi:phosphoribosylanthranilate isomerase